MYCKDPNLAAASLYAKTKSQDKTNPRGGPKRAGFYKRPPHEFQAAHPPGARSTGGDYKTRYETTN